MTDFDFDLITIGGGSGGVAASRRAASYGARVAIIEGSRYGGTCVIRGCVPKKLLVYAAQFRDHFEDSVGYGWEPHLPGFSWPTLIANKNKEVDRLNGIYEQMLRKSGVRVYAGWARLIDRHTVEVNGERLTARTILLATGGRAFVPDWPGAEHCITSTEALDLPELPRRLIIVGGGYIAVEFANVFQTLGTEVTMLLRGDELLRGFDDDIRVALSKEMCKRGIQIHVLTEIARIDAGPGGLTVTTVGGRTFDADHVLAATGRAPNVQELGLEAVGVKLDQNCGIEVDEWSRTSVDNIYAVGDVTNRVQLTPVAIAEGRAFAETLFNANPMAISYENIPTAVFSMPPIGTVGLTERAARAKYGAVDVYRTDFRPMKFTVAGRDERTLMKLVVDRRTDRVVGVHLIGQDTPEMIQPVAIALNAGATKAVFDRTIALHPTAAEELVLLRERVPDPEAEAAE